MTISPTPISPTQETKPTVIDATDINSFDRANQYLHDHINLERVTRLSRNRNPFKLDRITRILEQLDNPHQQLRHIHIAGTKGKGSTVAMLTASLHAAGLTIGSFTSPHLVDIRERIQINGRYISQHDFTKAMRIVALAVQRDACEEPPHFFEILTAMAFYYFAENAVDLTLIEVGLGGRLDCTNVIQPEVSVITQISYDHMNILGDSLAEIAREKAGIFKPLVPVISTPQVEEVEAVLRQEAERVGSPLRVLGREIEFTHRFQSDQTLGPHTRISVQCDDVNFDEVTVPLPGIHQACNTALTLAVTSSLRRMGFTLDTDIAVRGLSKTRLPGRMEYLPGKPPLLLDGAHNASSIHALFRAVIDHLNPDSLIVIFACNTDKDIPRMLQALMSSADKVIFTKVKHNPKAALPVNLAEQFSALDGRAALVADSLDNALKTATRAVTTNDLIVITGSFFLVAEAEMLYPDRVKLIREINDDPTSGKSPLAQLIRYRHHSH